MPSRDPKPGEIWLAYVEFLDHPGIGKVRPVFVIDVESEMCIAIAAKVTSKDLSANGSGNSFRSSTGASADCSNLPTYGSTKSLKSLSRTFYAISLSELCRRCTWNLLWGL